jgi:hypothetical protein
LGGSAPGFKAAIFASIGPLGPTRRTATQSLWPRNRRYSLGQNRRRNGNPEIIAGSAEMARRPRGDVGGTPFRALEEAGIDLHRDCIFLVPKLPVGSVQASLRPAGQEAGSFSPWLRLELKHGAVSHALGPGVMRDRTHRADARGIAYLLRDRPGSTGPCQVPLELSTARTPLQECGPPLVIRPPRALQGSCFRADQASASITWPICIHLAINRRSTCTEVALGSCVRLRAACGRLRGLRADLRWRAGPMAA